MSVPIEELGEKKRRQAPRLNPLNAALMNGITAMGSKLMMNPITRTQILYQVQNANLHAGVLDKPYMGVMDCVRHTFKSEGLSGMWRGSMPQVARAVPTSLVFAGFAYVCPPFRESHLPSAPARVFMNNVLMMSAASTLASALLYPLDYAHTRLSADVRSGHRGEHQFSSMLDVWSKSIRVGGYRALYRGFLPFIAGETVHRLALFSIFNVFNLVSDHTSKPSLIESGLMVLFASFCAYPLSTLTRRMAMSGLAPQSPFHGIRSGYKTMIQEGRWTPLRGFSITLMISLFSTMSVSILQEIGRYSDEIEVQRQQKRSEDQWKQLDTNKFEDKAQLLPRPRNL